MPPLEMADGCSPTRLPLSTWACYFDTGSELPVEVQPNDSEAEMGHQERRALLEGRRSLGPVSAEKFEMIDGKLLWSDEDRETLLALLLENVGADRAVQLGEAEVWRTAVAKLPQRA